jgi:proline racemase
MAKNTAKWRVLEVTLMNTKYVTPSIKTHRNTCTYPLNRTQYSPQGTNIVARMRRLLNKTGIGLTTGFIRLHTVSHNYSVYTLTASQFTIVLPSLLTITTDSHN